MRNLLDGRRLEGALAAAGNLLLVSLGGRPKRCRITHQVRNEAGTAYSLDGLLCGFRLLLPVYHGHVRHVNVQEVVLARSPPQLCHGLDKRHALDVAHSASKLDNANIRFFTRVVDGYTRNLLDPVLNSIGDVWHHLHRLAQVVALALALDDMAVNLARRNIVVTRKGDVKITLVVTKIEIDFTAVGEDEDFAVPVLTQYKARDVWLERKAYSFGFMVPASTLRYGSTLIDDTCWGVSG
jgi:hypothetical protein